MVDAPAAPAPLPARSFLKISKRALRALGILFLVIAVRTLVTKSRPRTCSIRVGSSLMIRSRRKL